MCIVSERAPEDYLSMLRDKGISYVVSGETSANLAHAVDLHGEHFGIRTLLLEGGGQINGAFLGVDLVDELSLLIVPGIDGRRDIATLFDGVTADRKAAGRLKLKSVQQRQNGTLWVRYEVVGT